VAQEAANRLNEALQNPHVELGVNCLLLARSTINKVLHKRLRLCAYKIQLVKQLKSADGVARQHFAEEMFDRIDLDVDFFEKIMFRDEATFHVSGKVHRHNVRIWGTENPHVREHIRDSPKVKVWCGVMHDQVIGPFFS
jgi:hypothetical protein